MTEVEGATPLTEQVGASGLRASRPVIYYGHGPLRELSAFDLAVLEPAGWSGPDLAALRERGVKVLAYVSLLEARPEVVQAAHLRPSDFLSVSGRPWYRDEFETFVVDPRSTAWRRYIEVRLHQIVAAGWDGVFLDGVGDVEDSLVENASGWLVPAAADLVRQVKTSVGRRLVVQNNGLWLVLPLVGPYLDGICWEGDVANVDFKEPWAQATVEMLTRQGNAFGLSLWLVSTIEEGAPPDKVAAFSALGQRLGCLTYAAPCDYAQGVRLPDGRVVRK